MIRRLFSTRYQRLDLDLVLLLIRLVFGSSFIVAGWPKIQHPTIWMGNHDLIPAAFQALAAIAEFIGGIALVLGFLTRLGAFGIACTMIVASAVLHFKWSAPYFSPATGGPSYILPVMLLLIALIFLVNGPGRFSLDRAVFGERRNASLHP